MTITSEMICKAEKIAEELFWEYEKVGIRVQDEPFEMGVMEHKSHVWTTDGEETDELLDGVCAQDVATLRTYRSYYYGKHVAIVAGNDYLYGQDPGEIILVDANVVAILA